MYHGTSTWYDIEQVYDDSSILRGSPRRNSIYLDIGNRIVPLFAENRPLTSSLSAALEVTLQNEIHGLYTTNASTPLAQGLGAYQYYKFGLYSRCGYLNETAGNCNNHTTGQQFQPFLALTQDMNPNNYSLIIRNMLPDSDFTNSKYTGQSTKAAYWMILLGTICAALALITCVLALVHRFYS